MAYSPKPQTKLGRGHGYLLPRLSGDLADVNYSSIRQGTLDERERWKEDQQFFIESSTPCF
ncbi:hypothetical protein LOK82_09810 [Xylella fastidiosa subsp. multiplex]|uniref:Uncharacterized protein n=1 Tax=Xylella fastidiosa subsp. multiplex TaxID=644357 RepID=A0AAW6HVV3_XYLFS|nr:hypothetical protein [Xylella fastidiosa subsp. multiplex]